MRFDRVGRPGIKRRKETSALCQISLEFIPTLDKDEKHQKKKKKKRLAHFLNFLSCFKILIYYWKKFGHTVHQVKILNSGPLFFSYFGSLCHTNFEKQNN